MALARQRHGLKFGASSPVGGQKTAAKAPFASPKARGSAATLAIIFMFGDECTGSVAVEQVSREPLSDRNPWLQGNQQGNMSQICSHGHLEAFPASEFRHLLDEFPDPASRENKVPIRQPECAACPCLVRGIRASDRQWFHQVRSSQPVDSAQLCLSSAATCRVLVRSSMRRFGTRLL